MKLYEHHEDRLFDLVIQLEEGSAHELMSRISLPAFSAMVPISYHGGGTIGFQHMLACKRDERLYVILLTNRNDANVEFLNEIFGQFLVPKD